MNKVKSQYKIVMLFGRITLLGPWWVHSLPSLVLREASGTLIFYIIFYGIYWALLMAGKPEIQKQQKTGTDNWVH